MTYCKLTTYLLYNLAVNLPRLVLVHVLHNVTVNLPRKVTGWSTFQNVCLLGWLRHSALVHVLKSLN
jgi:hypothetical protein